MYFSWNCQKNSTCLLEIFRLDFEFSVLHSPRIHQCPYGRHARGHPSLSQTSLILLFPSNSPCKYKNPNSLCTGYWQMPKLKMATKRQLNCSKSSPPQRTAPPGHASAVRCRIQRWFPYLSGVLGHSTRLLGNRIHQDLIFFLFWDTVKNFIVVVELIWICVEVLKIMVRIIFLIPLTIPVMYTMMLS